MLESIREPRDLDRLSPAELVGLSAKIRQFLIREVSLSRGHLGPNMGVVEFTIALHRVFESPRDPIVFDTGHQSCAHKLLTDRSGITGPGRSWPPRHVGSRRRG
ncbi:1-deoxy-D-xylulose-5-phosphate synthase N-terminal domain-containing protein [uncultured Agrococcus sp.]|uniref:1-deoxy-D-xylulose-5-phosphate synthase N-terminal domain-containing protein n=1 Tax=uncultured Agrococcus sp. TaxID=382258 RepID=UPI0025DDE046|nr:1-deoxy-D-xylulose-5-phosphate synthase N-terminal domain-containing protein [uncultured Agrococcus sp.]